MKNVMKIMARTMLFTLFCAVAGRAAPLVISYKDISNENTTVLGALGIPFGEVFDVEGILVPARDVWGADEMFRSVMLLKVEKVNGTLLSKAIYMRFFRQNTDIAMPEQIYRNLETGKMENEEQVKKKWETKYCGRRYAVTVVENGYFTGVPKNLPSNCDIWSGPPYGFTTALAVLHEREP